uniref:60S ribosomal protein L39-like n=1 Tax=Nelumbo nucifera TaxID=4432 RepID=A0A822XP03_NELNU|nr:TPA_asm: hypothetical protein HUJ06_022109 [Nelumbo nucifera]
MESRSLPKKMRQNRPIPHWIRMRTDNIETEMETKNGKETELRWRRKQIRS